MVRINIGNDVGHIMDAVSWCAKHIKKSEWDIDVKWPKTEYVFEFQNLEDASYFSLKWA